MVTWAGTWETEILVEDGKILGFGDICSSEADETVDAGGCWILPGGIDVHTHLDWDFGTTKTTDDMNTGTRAALYGGTTTVMNFIQPGRGESLRQLIGRWREKGRESWAHYGYHIVLPRLEDAWLDELPALPQYGVHSLKVFTAYPHELMLTDAELFQILRRAGQSGLLTMVHAENGPVIDILAEEEVALGHTAPRYHASSRPDILEGEAVYRVGALARVAKAPAYIVHLSSLEALRALKSARALGASLDAETCPQYLFINDEVYADRPFNDVAGYVYTPPSRRPEDVHALWEALLGQDIGIVASDHCPFDLHDGKQLGLHDFRCIPNGGPGIETRVPLLLDAAFAGRLTVERAAEILATNPAKRFGLYPKKGVLAPGSDADLIIVDPRVPSPALSADVLHQRVDYTPYAGQVLRGFPRDVMVGGRFCLRNGQWQAPNPRWLDAQFVGKG